MSQYIFNANKLTVAQLIAEMNMGCSVADMGLNDYYLSIVPTHYNRADSNMLFSNSLVKAFFYEEIAFLKSTTTAERNANFHSDDLIHDSMKHNSPLVFGIPTESKWSGYSLGYQG
jgi:hypothetical protein